MQTEVAMVSSIGPIDEDDAVEQHARGEVEGRLAAADLVDDGRPESGAFAGVVGHWCGLE